MTLAELLQDNEGSMSCHAAALSQLQSIDERTHVRPNLKQLTQATIASKMIERPLYREEIWMLS